MFSFAQRARTKCIGLHSGIQFLLGKLYWCSQTDREVDIPYQCNYYGAVYAQPLSSKEGVQLCGLFLVLFSGSSASTINKWRPEVDQRGGPAATGLSSWEDILRRHAVVCRCSDTSKWRFMFGMFWKAGSRLTVCRLPVCLPASFLSACLLLPVCHFVCFLSVCLFYCRFPCHLSPVYSPYV